MLTIKFAIYAAPLGVDLLEQVTQKLWVGTFDIFGKDALCHYAIARFGMRFYK